MFKVNNENTKTTSVNFNKQAVLLYLSIWVHGQFDLGYNIHIALRQRRVRTTWWCAQAGFELLSIIIDQYQQNNQSERFI